MTFGSVSFSSYQSALGSAVLQFLWQGALIGLFAGVLLGCLRQRSSAERYVIAYGALLLCLLSFIVSFATALADLSLGGGASVLQASLAPDESAGGLQTGAGTAGIAAWCWTAGVLCMAGRFALQCHGAQRLKITAVFEPDASWQRIFQSLKEELGVSRSVRLLRSGLAEVPMVVGWFSPVVLVPASAFTGLGPDQLRSLLAHELAHIRRLDHLLNAAQAVVEIVLFFHPVVWWISKQVRLEREYCCDDSSVRLTGDPRPLAEALAAMEALRIHEPQTRTVLAANGGPLMQRIARILGARPDGRVSITSWHLPAGFVLAGVLAVAGSAQATPTLPVELDPVAQDDMTPEAREIWARLQVAVESGRITEAQAKERFAAWRKGQAEKKKPAQDDLSPEAKQVLAELEAAVKAGKITKEQAKERFAGWKKRGAQQQGDAPDLREVWAKLQAAVKAGEMTEEEAREKITAMRKAQAEKAGARQAADPEAVLKRIQAAVESGRITPEQGKERIEAYKAQLAQKKAEREKAIQGVTLRIKAAVEAGRITPEQGQERLEGFKKSLDEGGNTVGRQPTVEEAHQAHREAVSKELKAAVKSGKITKEQAKERMKALEKALAEREAELKKREQIEKAIAKIQAAIEAGRLTPEQGREKIEALKKGPSDKAPEKKKTSGIR